MSGGKDKKGEPLNKLRLFKGSSFDGKIVHGEFVNIRGSGTPPCGRFGHSMGYLPTNNCLIVRGGRNDSMCQELGTPFFRIKGHTICEYIKVSQSGSFTYDIVRNHMIKQELV